MNQQQITTKSVGETQDFAQKFAGTMNGGEVLLLYGNLGAGKTTFMQGFAKGLGVEQRITSPTFIIVRSYVIPNLFRDLKKEDNKMLQQVQHDSLKRLYHIDLYRTESDADLEGIGMKEILEEKNAIVAIEWPEKLRSFLPRQRIEIRFETLDGNERKITIKRFKI